MTSANETKLRSRPPPSLLAAESCAETMIGFIGRVGVPTRGPAFAFFLTGMSRKSGYFAAAGAKRKIGHQIEARSLGFACRGPALTGEHPAAESISPQRRRCSKSYFAGA